MILNLYTTKPEELPADKEVLYTGAMGSCVCVIVLYNKIGNRYSGVRGWHGNGGAEAIKMNLLLENIENKSTNKIIIIPGAHQQSDTAYMDYYCRVDDEKIMRGMWDVDIEVVKGFYANAKINRQGEVELISGGLYSQF